MTVTARWAMAGNRDGGRGEYEYRRGHIEVIDSCTGAVRCRECGSTGMCEAFKNHEPNTRAPLYACHNCGVDSRAVTGPEVPVLSLPDAAGANDALHGWPRGAGCGAEA